MNVLNAKSAFNIIGPMHPGFEEVLTVGAMNFVADLHRRFNARRIELLQQRQKRQGQPQVEQGFRCYLHS